MRDDEVDSKFSSYTYGEARTGLKQLVEFTCTSEDLDEVKAFLRTKVRTLELQTTHTVNVSHGGYGRYSRYQVVQHKYAGGGAGGCCGYIEVLEIKNAPDGRCSFVVHEWTSGKGGWFTEWETLANALAAWECGWSGASKLETFAKLAGFKRRVPCGQLSPWFYAIGDEELVGDYALPFGVEDDPVFRLGRKFLVTDDEGNVSLKTCMGTRFVREIPDPSFYGGRRSGDQVLVFRLVYWDGGSVWDERCNRSDADRPRPLETGEEWIAAAVEQFIALLSGNSKGFSINFTNGAKFVGRLVEGKSRSSPTGEYYAVVHFTKGEKQEGRFEFKPTPDVPTVRAFLINALTKKFPGKTIARMRITRKRVSPGEKKWAGVFFKPSSS